MNTDGNPTLLLEMTGERHLPGTGGQIEFEHMHRYLLARELREGTRVLDVACGEGYGSDLLAAPGIDVVGVDIADEAVTHATAKYGRAGLRFVEASAAELPFEDGSFDTVVSFETIEHHDQHEAMLREIKRVLAPGGRLVISSPNRQHYSIEPGYSNPFHVKELFREEFVALVGKHFNCLQVLGQRVVHGSLVVNETAAGGRFRSMRADGAAVEAVEALRKPLYDIIVASDAPIPAVASSLFEATVHALDPALFYGQHLPDRVAQADARIAALEADLSRAPMPADEARDLLQAISAELADARRIAQELLVRESTLAGTVASLTAGLAAADERLVAANAELASMSRQLVIADEDRAGLRGRLEASEVSMVSAREELASIGRALEEAQARRRQMEGSRSWRYTSWLRTVVGLLRGER